jgi:hypothetical protein
MEHSLASAAVRETAGDGRGPGSHILPSASARARTAAGGPGLGPRLRPQCKCASSRRGRRHGAKARIADDSSCRSLVLIGLDGRISAAREALAATSQRPPRAGPPGPSYFGLDSFKGA